MEPALKVLRVPLGLPDLLDLMAFPDLLVPLDLPVVLVLLDLLVVLDQQDQLVDFHQLKYFLINLQEMHLLLDFI